MAASSSGALASLNASKLTSASASPCRLLSDAVTILFMLPSQCGLQVREDSLHFRPDDALRDAFHMHHRTRRSGAARDGAMNCA